MIGVTFAPTVEELANAKDGYVLARVTWDAVSVPKIVIDARHVLPVSSLKDHRKNRLPLEIRHSLELTGGGVSYSKTPENLFPAIPKKWTQANEVILQIGILKENWVRNHRNKTRLIATRFYLKKLLFHECEMAMCPHTPRMISISPSNEIMSVCKKHSTDYNEYFFDELERAIGPLELEGGSGYRLVRAETYPASPLLVSDLRQRQLDHVHKLQEKTGATIDLGDPRSFAIQDRAQALMWKYSPHGLIAGGLGATAAFGLLLIPEAVSLIPVAVGTALVGGVAGLVAKLAGSDEAAEEIYPDGYKRNKVDPLVEKDKKKKRKKTPALSKGQSILVNMKELRGALPVSSSGVAHQVDRLIAATEDILHKEEMLEADPNLSAQFNHIMGELAPSTLAQYCELPPSYHRFPNLFNVVKDVQNQLEVMNAALREVREKLFRPVTEDLRVKSVVVQDQYRLKPDLAAQSYGKEGSPSRI